VMRWNAEQLDHEQESVLARWPETACLQIPQLGDVLFCHATPRNDTEILTRVTPESSLLPCFRWSECDPRCLWSYSHAIRPNDWAHSSH
jgi:hypothetical protein